jgi:hypothetical protein
MTIAIAGFVIGAASLNTGARYFAMVLMIAGGHGADAVVIAWVAKTMLRPRMKRAAAVAFVNACGNVAQVSAPADSSHCAKPGRWFDLIICRYGLPTCTPVALHATPLL